MKTLPYTLIILLVLLTGACSRPAGPQRSPEVGVAVMPDAPDPEPSVPQSAANAEAPVSSASPAVNATTHGFIERDEIWRGEIVIVGDVIVREGVTLTIEPGTIVLISANSDVNNLMVHDEVDLRKGMQDADEEVVNGVHWGEPWRDEGNHVTIEVLGTLHAVGTPEEMIAFHSNSPTPGIYDWNRLVINNGILSYALVENYRILNAGDGVVISHSTLRNVGECAIGVTGRVTIEGNRIYNTGHELIDIHGASPLIRGNHLGPNKVVCVIVDRGSAEITGNTFEECGSAIAYLHPDTTPVIEDNEFINCGQEIYYDYPQ